MDMWKNIAREFQDLWRKDPKNVPSTVSERPLNIDKNRYCNILPYDRNRFLFASKDGGNSSRYINASYVSGYAGEKEYICTQGPLDNTVDDFWAMCWESEAAGIAMLSRCYEHNWELCFPYWPLSEKSVIGVDSEVKVTLEKQSAYRMEGEDKDSDNWWLVSDLKMKKEEEVRYITHFSFLGWPDYGVVDPPIALLSFVKHFRKMVPAELSPQKPVIVHCSAGVGRTGAFVVADSIYRNFQASQTLPDAPAIISTIRKMRTERMWMVQTLQQCQLLYLCLQDLKEGNVIPDAVEISTETIRLSDWGFTDE